MKTVATAVLSLSLAALCPTGAIAQGAGSHAGHGGAHHAAPTLPKEIADLPSVKAFQAANDKMHNEMAIAFTGNADADFVRGMIPHHQGAVDMAKIVLEHGKDPEIRRLARNIIKSQEAEIAMMKGWLKKLESKGAQGQPKAKSSPAAPHHKH
jgi:uncharacterized protein (DUF305 family)